MGDKPVRDLPPSKRGGGIKGRPSPLLRYSDKFEELCGYYMSIGMSYHDFWDGDCCMVKYYREKAVHDRERDNFELWLQGAYIYEALLDVSPVFNALSKRQKPYPYMKNPIPMTAAESERNREQENREKLKNGKEAMKVMVENFNKKFLEKQGKGGVKDGD